MSELPRTKDFQRATEIAGAIKRRLPIRRSSAAAAKQSHVMIAEVANVTATVGIAPREDYDDLMLQLALAGAPMRPLSPNIGTPAGWMGSHDAIPVVDQRCHALAEEQD